MPSTPLYFQEYEPEDTTIRLSSRKSTASQNQFKLFRTSQPLDHIPSKVLKTMCEEFWETLQGGLELTKTSDYLHAKPDHMNDLI